MYIYLVTGENEEYSLSRSLIVISKQKSYIQIGSIINKKDKTNIASQKDYKISVYYGDELDKKLLFSSTGSEPLYTNLNNRENDNYKELLYMIDNLYLLIETEEKQSEIKLNTHQDYVNNHLFSLKTHDFLEEDNSKDTLPLTLEEPTSTNAKTNKDWIIIEPIEYETQNKKLSLSANCLESENLCRVVFTTTWKYRPITNSYDVVGVRLSDTIFLDDNFTSFADDEINPEYNYHSHRGFASVFDLSTNTINSITQTFNVEYGGSIYATYQHASIAVSLDDAKNFNFSSTGNGEVFSWKSKKTQKSYDDMLGIKLILKEEK